jgi:2TM domain
MDEKQKYRLARKRVEAKIGFYIHAGVFVAVNLLLVAINLTTSPNEIWFIYPLGGWGAGLLLHFFLAFSQISTSDWKKKMIDREMDRLK